MNISFWKMFQKRGMTVISHNKSVLYIVEQFQFTIHYTLNFS